LPLCTVPSKLKIRLVTSGRRRELYLDVAGKTFSGPLTEHRLG
jgi:hypothetical protein